MENRFICQENQIKYKKGLTLYGKPYIIKPEVKKGGKQVRRRRNQGTKKDDNQNTKLAIVLAILMIIEKVLDIIFTILEKLGLI